MAKGITPAISIAALASDAASDQEKEIAKALDIAVKLARQGPGHYQRQGSRNFAPKVPWSPPESVVFDHPDYGMIEVKVATGEISVKADEAIIAEEIAPIEPGK